VVVSGPVQGKNIKPCPKYQTPFYLVEINIFNIYSSIVSIRDLLFGRKVWKFQSGISEAVVRSRAVNTMATKKRTKRQAMVNITLYRKLKPGGESKWYPAPQVTSVCKNDTNIMRYANCFEPPTKYMIGKTNLTSFYSEIVTNNMVLKQLKSTTADSPLSWYHQFLAIKHFRTRMIQARHA
jgi:hypothetical protein